MSSAYGESGPSQDFNPPADLFKDSHGRSLRIFAEPSRVPDSARLLRLLQRGGATLTSPSDAEIFLIATENGDNNNLSVRMAVRRDLIDEWDAPPQRVVLDLEWAYAALRQNRVSLRVNDWGGYHLGSNNGSPVMQHPLPTPRQTPSDTTADQAASSFTIPMPNCPENTQAGRPQMPYVNLQLPPGTPQIPAHLIEQLVQIQTTHSFMATMTDIMRHAQAVGVLPNNIQPPLMNTTTHDHIRDNDNIVSPVDDQISSASKHGPKSKHKAHGHRSKRQRSAMESGHEDHSSESESHSERAAKKRQRASSKPTGVARRPGAIFVDDDGESLALYLQLGIPHRSHHVESIKRNGGRIATNIEDATYVVLYAFDKHNYSGCLSTCNQLEKLAVSPEFVKTCLDERKLMDAEYFLVEDAVVVTRKPGRGRPKIKVMHRDVAMRREVAAKEEESALSTTKSTPAKATFYKSKRSKSTLPKVTFSKVIPSTRSERVVLAVSKLDRRPTSRSPSPALPPLEAVKWSEGKNMYTEEECAYMLQYMHKLFKRDPEATSSALSKKIHEKMPQHPAASWMSQFRKHEAEIEKIRRRVAIQLRKKQSAFEDIVTWFLEGKADTLADKDVWPALASEYPYMNDSDWQSFWQSRDVSISEEVEARRKSS